jgi:hypothetical protein
MIWTSSFMVFKLHTNPPFGWAKVVKWFSLQESVTLDLSS